MGTVFRATDTELHRPVAIKVLSPDVDADPEFRERFVREARLLAALDHPSVVPIYEAGEVEGLLFLAMRYVPGRDLGLIIRTEAPLEPIRTLRLLGQIALALDAAHALGLVHRDVKPANILVSTDATGRERAILVDFGLTRRLGSGSAVTRLGGLSGSVGVMAPEQIAGRSVDGRVDQYALACVAFACVTGHLPYDNDQEAAILFGHAHSDPPDLTSERPDLPMGLSAVLGRGLAKEPDRRYPTCWDLIVAAAGALDTDAHALVGVEPRDSRARPSPGSRPDARGGPPTTSGPIAGRLERSRWRARLAMASVAGVGLAMVTVVNAWPRGGSIPPFDARAVSTTDQIVFVGGSGRASELYSVRPDGTGLRRLTDNDWLEAGPAISRDGISIAYAAERKGNRDIYVMSAEGSVPRRLTLATEPDDEPAWAWDTPAIAFTRGTRGADLYLVDDAFAEESQTARSERLTTGPATDASATWSPDGLALAMSSDRSGSRSVWRLGPDSEEWRVVTTGGGRDLYPTWSPDGAWIAFVREDGSGHNDLFRVRPDGADLERLTSDDREQGPPAWSHDGRHLVYTEARDERSALVILDVSSRASVRIGVDVAGVSDPDWGPRVGPGQP